MRDMLEPDGYEVEPRPTHSALKELLRSVPDLVISRQHAGMSGGELCSLRAARTRRAKYRPLLNGPRNPGSHHACSGRLRLYRQAFRAEELVEVRSLQNPDDGRKTKQHDRRRATRDGHGSGARLGRRRHDCTAAPRRLIYDGVTGCRPPLDTRTAITNGYDSPRSISNREVFGFGSLRVELYDRVLVVVSEGLRETSVRRASGRALRSDTTARTAYTFYTRCRRRVGPRPVARERARGSKERGQTPPHRVGGTAVDS